MLSKTQTRKRPSALFASRNYIATMVNQGQKGSIPLSLLLCVVSGNQVCDYTTAMTRIGVNLNIRKRIGVNKLRAGRRTNITYSALRRSPPAPTPLTHN